MSIQALNYINGRFIGVSSCGPHEHDQAIVSLNPANLTDVLGTAPDSNEDSVDEAVYAANKAFPAWRNLGMVKRAEYLWRVARRIEDRVDTLTDLVVRESGKQRNEARADIIEALHMVQYDFAVGHTGSCGKVFADEVPNKRCYELTGPRGIVAAISPWNFPIAIPFWLSGLSLIYGNCVILKPSEETPLCGDAIAKIFHEAGIPSGVFQVVHGTGEKAGWALVKHHDVHSVLFTGSYEVGAKIKQEVAKHPHKICAIETGGKNAVIVLDDARLDIAVDAAVLSAFKTAGQRCVSASRIFVGAAIFEKFVKEFCDATSRIRVGNPIQDNVFYGPMINKSGVGKGLRFNNLVSMRSDMQVLIDRNNEPFPTPSGYWLRPFVYTTRWQKPEKRAPLIEEVFAPHVAIISCYSVEDAVAYYNDTEYGLAASIITEDYRKARYAEDNLECGIFYWNLPCIGAGVRLPFGGVKKSGNLIPSAAGIIPAITHLKAVTHNYGTEIVMAQGLSTKV